MKTFRKIFIGALVVLFGSWVNMQAQDVAADANTIVKTVKHSSSKSAKQKRAKGYLATHQGIIEFSSGIKVNFKLDFDCNFKGVKAIASDIVVSPPDSKPFPLSELRNYIYEKDARINGLRKQFADLRHDRPGESEDSYNMRHDELKRLWQEISYNSDMITSASNVYQAVENYLDSTAQYIATGVVPDE